MRLCFSSHAQSGTVPHSCRQHSLFGFGRTVLRDEAQGRKLEDILNYYFACAKLGHEKFTEPVRGLSFVSHEKKKETGVCGKPYVPALCAVE